MVVMEANRGYMVKIKKMFSFVTFFTGVKEMLCLEKSLSAYIEITDTGGW